MLLAKPKSNVEVFNDIDKQLVNFYQIIRNQSTLKKLLRLLSVTLVSRSDFEDALTYTEDAVESARRLLIRNRQSFSALGLRWSYSVKDSVGGSATTVRRWHASVQRLIPVHQRFQQVQIENLDFRSVLKRYDTPETLFYIDPPYLKETRVSGSYHYELNEQDHIDLVQILMTLQGKVVLSGYANKLYEALELAGWQRFDFPVVAFLSGNRAKRIESIWCKPLTLPTTLVDQKSHGLQTDNSESSIDGRVAGARRTHLIRANKSEKMIIQAIAELTLEQRKVTYIAVALKTNISREHLGRRYRHLFLNKVTD